MNWIQIFIAALVAMNISHYVILNQMRKDIERIRLSDAALFKRLEILDDSVSGHQNELEFVKKRGDDINLRMAAYENTI